MNKQAHDVSIELPLLKRDFHVHTAFAGFPACR